jgi:hypothetical protein
MDSSNFLLHLLEGNRSVIDLFRPLLQHAALFLKLGPIAAMFLAEALTGSLQFGFGFSALLNPLLTQTLEVRFALAQPMPGIVEVRFQFRAAGIEFRLAAVKLVLPHSKLVGQLNSLGAKLLGNGSRVTGAEWQAGGWGRDGGRVRLHKGRMSSRARFRRVQMGSIDAHIRPAALVPLTEGVIGKWTGARHPSCLVNLRGRTASGARSNTASSLFIGTYGRITPAKLLRVGRHSEPSGAGSFTNEKSGIGILPVFPG